MSASVGEAFFQELLWVHGMIWQDLAGGQRPAVVDRLEGDHRRVAEQLDEVEAASRR